MASTSALPNVRWSDRITASLLRDQVIASVLIALAMLGILLVIDWAVEQIATPDWLLGLRDYPTIRQRSDFVHSLLTLFGLPTSVLVALISFAVPVLRPSATAGALLLHRPYPSRWLDRSSLSFVRHNPFYFAFVVAVGLSLALLALTTSLAAGLTRAQLPTLFTATSFAAVAGFLLIRSIVWTLRMRDGMALVGHVRQLGLNVIAHGAGHGRCTLLDQPSIDGLLYVEQVELQQCIDTLHQQALHVTDQPAASRAALPALRDLRAAALAAGAPELWRHRDVAVGPDPWLEDQVVSALTLTVITSVQHRDAQAGAAAISILLDIGVEIAQLPTPQLADQAVMDRVLGAFREAFQSCVEGREFILREELILALTTLLERLSDPRTRTIWRDTDTTETAPPPNAWAGYLREQGRRYSHELLLPCVLAQDGDAMRSALRVCEVLTNQQYQREDARLEAQSPMPPLYGPDEARIRLIEIVFNLIAHAVAAGAADAAYVLLSWIDTSDQDQMGDRLIVAQSRVLEAAVRGSPLWRPAYVTIDDLRMVLVLASSLGRSRYPAALLDEARRALTTLGGARVAEEIDRICVAGGASDAFRLAWRAELASL